MRLSVFLMIISKVHGNLKLRKPFFYNLYSDNTAIEANIMVALVRMQGIIFSNCLNKAVKNMTGRPDLAHRVLSFVMVLPVGLRLQPWAATSPHTTWCPHTAHGAWGQTGTCYVHRAEESE